MAQLDVTVKETGISQTAEKLDELATSGDRAEKATAAMESSVAKADSRILAYIESLKLQNATFGQSQDAIYLYRAKLMGATEAQLAEIESIQKDISAKKEMASASALASAQAVAAAQAEAAATKAAADAAEKEAQRKSASVDSYIESLKLQNATFGQSQHEVDLYRAKLLGATDAQVREIQAIQQAISAKQNLASATNAAGGASSNLGKNLGKIPFGQIGYQVQDLTTQLQMGTSAFVAIGQQGSQLAGAFGPGGAVIGAVIALGSAIAGMAYNAANAEADLSALEAAGRRLADLNLDTLVRMNDAQRDLADPANKQRYKELGDEILSLTQKYENQGLVTKALLSEQQKLQDKYLDDPSIKNKAALQEASAKRKESLAEEAKLRSQINGIQKQQDALYQGEIDKKRELDKQNRKAEKPVASTGNPAAKQASKKAHELDEKEAEKAVRLAQETAQKRIAIAKKEREQIESIEQGKRELAASVDPIAALEQERAARLEVIAKYDLLENANHQAAIDARKAADLQYEEGLNYAREERFRNESQANEFLMDSLDSLSHAASNAVSGLITGTMSANDALRNLASTIVDSAVSALVDLGVQYLKNMIIGETASAAAVATAAATGTAMAAAYAPAAAMVSLASFGANAAPAMAGITSTVATTQGLALLSGRMQGGQVSAGDVRMVGERGPELVQFGRNGMVTPNSALGGTTTTQVVNNIHNYAGAAVTTQTNSDGSTDIFIRKDELADLLASQAGNPNSKMNRAQGGVYERRRA